MQFMFMQPVMTPRGAGFYIHPLTDGTSCQVAIRENGVQKNPIFRIKDITSLSSSKRTHRTSQEPVTVSQADDKPLDSTVSAANAT